MTQNIKEDQQISHAVARIQGGILAFVMALFFGLGLFIITILLVLKGGPNMGQHLALLGQYFIGYDVSWGGAFLGLFYGALTGGLFGWFIGVIYNLITGTRSKS